MQITRCVVIALMFLIFPLAFSPILAQRSPTSKSHYIVYVGTYTTKQASKGIYAFDFDPASGQLKELGLAAESVDPSFLAIHPNGKHLYAVNETTEFAGQKGGAVSAFAIDRSTSKLKLLNQVASGGAGPCHISLDRAGKFVLVANYDGGSVATFPLRDDGSLGPASSVVQHHGSSVNKERQEGPHAHWIATSPDNRFVLAADLGVDEVLVYRFDATKGTLSPNDPPFVKVAPGSGPRHFAFHPSGRFGYVLTEMAATITTFSYDSAKGTLSAVQTIPTLSKGHSGPTEAAELVVHPSGKFLYASNRAGIDMIDEFSINPVKGTLMLFDTFSTKGKTPRNFAIDPTGSFLFAGNQESGNIVIFRINLISGALTPTGQVLQVPAPVCVVFFAASEEQASSDQADLSSDSQIARAGVNGVGIPECLYCPNPPYTNAARAAEFEGAATLLAVITKEGRATNMQVVKDPGFGLRDKAIEAIKKWRFRAAEGPDGRPVDVIVPIQVTFRLPKS
jgi:6-phosphogluconolactonase